MSLSNSFLDTQYCADPSMSGQPIWFKPLAARPLCFQEFALWKEFNRGFASRATVGIEQRRNLSLAIRSSDNIVSKGYNWSLQRGNQHKQIGCLGSKLSVRFNHAGGKFLRVINVTKGTIAWLSFRYLFKRGFYLDANVAIASNDLHFEHPLAATRCPSVNRQSHTSCEKPTRHALRQGWSELVLLRTAQPAD
jgi:hypothetical protein